MEFPVGIKRLFSHFRINVCVERETGMTGWQGDSGYMCHLSEKQKRHTNSLTFVNVGKNGTSTSYSLMYNIYYK